LLTMPPHETRIRVRYAETDQMGVVYYANYLVWMEVGRVEYCKACGFEYKQMELEDGVFLAVAEARCRYASPARFDEEVVIRTWVEEANPRMVLFAYQMRLSADGRKLATGETKHIFLGRDLRPCRMPEKYRGKFGAWIPNFPRKSTGGSSVSMHPEQIKTLARECGFELAGIAAVGPAPEARYYAQWIAGGMAGEMRYLTDRRAGLRDDARHLLPSARSILCVGKLYNGPQPYSTQFAGEDLAWISRYAWGEDYHQVLRRGLAGVVDGLRAASPAPFEWKICV